MRPKAVKANEFDTLDERLKVANELLSEIRALNERVAASEENEKALHKRITQLNKNLKESTGAINTALADFDQRFGELSKRIFAPPTNDQVENSTPEKESEAKK